jgi:hypothetical protein
MKKEINFIDLGLYSGTKWADCYISSLVFREDFQILTENEYNFLKEHLPTIEQFRELGRLCKIRRYSKGMYRFLLITGPNGNKVRIFESKWNKALGFLLIDYWINNGFLTDQQKIPENIGAFIIGEPLISTTRRCANLIFVDL